MFDQTNINEVSFVALALQTQQQINDAYMRKMNRDYSAYSTPAHIPNPNTTSLKIIPISYPVPEWFNSEQESS